MRLLLATILTAMLLPSLAEARPRHHPHPHVRVVTPAPSVRVVVSPWVLGYRPAPRAGWVWVEGYQAADGSWVPGYWAPASPRPGFAWVPGHWEGESYVEGYWREEYRPASIWIEGHYEHGRFIPGYWAPAGPPSPPPEPPAVHHDYE